MISSKNERPGSSSLSMQLRVSGLDVVPGTRLGPFVLGMPVAAAIRILQENERAVGSVELQHATEVEKGDLRLDLIEHGFRLHFSAATLTLQFVHVYELSKVRLVYDGKSFTGSRAPSDPSLLALYHCFGPSYPGTLNGSDYLLNYPGVGFVLPLPPQFSHLYADAGNVPVELPDKSVPLAVAMRVFRGKQLASPRLVGLERTRALEGWSRYFLPVVLRLGWGIVVGEESLPLRTGVQDVLSVLGPPEGRYNKTDDKLKIHSELRAQGSGDYFFNYFSLGLDVLFEGESGRVSKFVVHSNWATHDSFNQYSRCNWRVEDANGVACQCGDVWSDALRARLGLRADGEPVVYNRPSDDSQGHLTTLFYGRHGLVLEVMRSLLVQAVQIYV